MKLSKCLVAMFLAVACSSGAMAQNAPGDFLMMYDIQVKSGANAQFEEFFKKIKEAADKVNAPQRWIAAQATYGRPGNNYFIALQFDKWGALDGWNQQVLVEAFGEDEAAKIGRSGSMAIESSKNTISRLLTNLSYNADTLAPAPMYRVRISEVKRDMQQDYRHFITKVNEAWEKAGDKRTIIRRVSTMGPSAIYYSAVPFTNWSEWDERGGMFMQRMEKAHGEVETRQLMDTISKCIVSSENFVLTVRPDLSRMPESSPTSN